MKNKDMQQVETMLQGEGHPNVSRGTLTAGHDNTQEKCHA
jgi:hypothetical protein